jgi:hypothetical protein
VSPRRAAGFGALVALAATVALVAVVRSRRAEPAGLALPPVVPCTVTVADPASGLATVRVEAGVEALARGREWLFGFADVRGGPQMVRAFAAEVDGRRVAAGSESYRGALVYRVPVAPRARRLVVAYTIDPTFYPPGTEQVDAADARSRITADLAVVRSTSLLPVVNLPGCVLGVEFVLPANWVAVTPWATDGDRLLAPVDPASPVEYLALGPFATRTLPVGAATVSVAALDALEGSPFPVEAILQRVIELVGAPLTSAGRTRGLPARFVAIVVPPGFMHGGAAGARTIVQLPEPHVLAHEVFHWWNTSALTSRDAGWFREGLTEFYGIKVAREAGAWTAEQEAACLADLNAEMRAIERTGARGLREASLDPTASRLVYSKGALFWTLVDRRLHAGGRYLEEAVRRVVTSDREDLSTEQLRELFSSIYDGLVDDAFDRYVVGNQPLPDPGLDQATGRSGCARNVPAGQ